MVDVMSFTEAIADSEPFTGSRFALLGNGFSIDWNKDIFLYNSLYEEANLSDLTVGKAELFDSLDTRDFEKVMDHLKGAAKLVELYGSSSPDLPDIFLHDAKVVQHGLAEVLAQRHPNTPGRITTSERQSARKFLSHFDAIYTVSYDLLVYWVTNNGDGSTDATPKRDGFQWPTFEDHSRLIFKRRIADQSADVFYLHGALHLFVNDRRLEKLKWDFAPLIDQVQGRLEDGQYPLVVTEGSSAEKLEKIAGSAYLTYAHGRFKDLAGAVFIHGLSLSENDDHILASLEARTSEVERLYIGLHGSATTAAAAKVISRAHTIAERREEAGGSKLIVEFYDSTSAHVWR